MAFGDDKFYSWEGKTLVLDPGVFSWDLPRRGADWQVQYFGGKGTMGDNDVVSELEQSGQHLVTAAEAAAQQVQPAMSPVEVWVRQNPILALAVGGLVGAFLYKMLKRRELRANPDAEAEFRRLIRGGAARDDENFLGRVGDLMHKKYGYSGSDIDRIMDEEGA
jgi:hypothetical protein